VFRGGEPGPMSAVPAAWPASRQGRPATVLTEAGVANGSGALTNVHYAVHHAMHSGRGTRDTLCVPRHYDLGTPGPSVTQTFNQCQGGASLCAISSDQAH
jgi:hypothetical protein